MCGRFFIKMNGFGDFYFAVIVAIGVVFSRSVLFIRISCHWRFLQWGRWLYNCAIVHL